MRIIIISGQRNADIQKALQQLNLNDCIQYPESEILHNYDLSEKVMELCDACHTQNRDLKIVTYSEIVVNSARLWAIRTNNIGLFKMVSVMDNGETRETKMDESGELIKWEDGVFDIQQLLLSEIFKAKLKLKINDKTKEKKI